MQRRGLPGFDGCIGRPRNPIPRDVGCMTRWPDMTGSSSIPGIASSPEGNRMPHFVVEEPSSADIAFLEARLYEFNAATTGIEDGRLLGVFLRDDCSNIVAGAAGHTWGETCE